MRKLLLVAAAVTLGFTTAPYAQVVTGSQFQTQQAGKTVEGIVTMCINGSNLAVPCSGTTPAPPAGTGNINTGQVTIGTTATQVVAARAGRASVKITDLGTVDIFCGPAGVTTATGDLLAGIKGGSITIPTTAAVYCVDATGTQAVSFMETY